MENYSIILFILAVMIVLSAVANKIKIPYPVFLVAAGIGVGLLPHMPVLDLNPEVIFLIFLPPLLFDAAFNISLKELTNNITTVATLAIPLVLFTTTAVAISVHFLIPGLAWLLTSLRLQQWPGPGFRYGTVQGSL